MTANRSIMRACSLFFSSTPTEESPPQEQPSLTEIPYSASATSSAKDLMHDSSVTVYTVDEPPSVSINVTPTVSPNLTISISSPTSSSSSVSSSSPTLSLSTSPNVSPDSSGETKISSQTSSSRNVATPLSTQSDTSTPMTSPPSPTEKSTQLNIQPPLKKNEDNLSPRSAFAQAIADEVKNKNRSSLHPTSTSRFWYYTFKFLSFREDDILITRTKQKLYFFRFVQTSLALYGGYTAFSSTHLTIDGDDTKNYSNSAIAAGLLFGLASFLIAQHSLGSLGDILSVIKKYIEILIAKLEVVTNWVNADRYAQWDRDRFLVRGDIQNYSIVSHLHQTGAYEIHGIRTLDMFRENKLGLTGNQLHKFNFLERQRKITKANFPKGPEFKHRRRASS